MRKIVYSLFWTFLFGTPTVGIAMFASGSEKIEPYRTIFVVLCSILLVLGISMQVLIFLTSRKHEKMMREVIREHMEEKEKGRKD